MVFLTLGLATMSRTYKVICHWCGVEFEAHHSACGFCCQDHKSLAHNVSNRKYNASEKGKKKNAVWHTSPAGIVSAERYRISPKGRINDAKGSRTFLKTEKSKAYLRKVYRARGNNHHWRTIGHYKIYVLQEPCVLCGEANQDVLQCDHVVSRCLWWYLREGDLAGVHDESNLQILCKKCHRKKTKVDIVLIREVWKDLKVGGYVHG